MTIPPVQANLSFTGERFLPESRGEIWHEHWHRYALALPLARGRRVLDAACGEGYGSALLASVAGEVTGVDIAPEATAHATRRYGAPNLRFRTACCTALPLPAASVDLVVSFETIEHLAEQHEMLAEFRRVLAPDGVLLISSPNRPEYAALGPARNDFHVRELDREEFAALLDPLFPRQAWYGQSIVARSALWRLDAAPASAQLLALDGECVEARREPASAVYFVVVATAAQVDLPALPDLSLFGDPGKALLDHYRSEVRARVQLHWDEQNMRKIADEREARLVVAVNDLSAERKIADEREARLVVAVSALSAERKVADSLRNDLAAVEARAVELQGRVDAQSGELAALRSRLAWRESLAGWLRWPLHRLRRRLTGDG